jgi:hypothetical protein
VLHLGFATFVGNWHAGSFQAWSCIPSGTELCTGWAGDSGVWALVFIGIIISMAQVLDLVYIHLVS